MKHTSVIEDVLKNQSNFFSDLSIRLDQNDYEDIKNVILDIESKLSGTIDFKKQPSGVFMSYDFHITDDGPKLIEINTNAGGSVLFEKYLEYREPEKTENKFDLEIIKMFESEWRKSSTLRDLKTIVILDNNPVEQKLYPEFLLIQTVLQNAGYEVFISSPEDIKIENNHLLLNGKVVDLIYNRHTDFYLLSKEMLRIKTAFENKQVVLTPNPHVYDTFANKKHFIELSKIEAFKKFIPETILITKENAEIIWQNKKEYFFKPLTGYGSKGVYCGKKITEKVWGEIRDLNYIAQKCSQPKKIMVDVGGKDVALKYDIRFITYEGKIIFMFSRVYSGQATNMKTAGGGFAKIILDSVNN